MVTFTWRKHGGMERKASRGDIGKCMDSGDDEWVVGESSNWWWICCWHQLWDTVQWMVRVFWQKWGMMYQPWLPADDRSGEVTCAVPYQWQQVGGECFGRILTLGGHLYPWIVLWGTQQCRRSSFIARADLVKQRINSRHQNRPLHWGKGHVYI